MKKMLVALSLGLALPLSGLGGAQAQTIPISPNMFGINYWYYDYAGGFDMFDAKKNQVKAAGITLVRLGGLLPQKKVANSDLPYFDLAIDRVLAIGGTPLVQLPINLAPGDIPVWVEHFKNRGIVYWAIGNEPEPSSGFYQWYKGLPLTAGGPVVREHGNTYAEFRAKFVSLARAVKAAVPGAVVVGPDFHQFYGTSKETDPLMSYYPGFIADVGALTENGKPLLDIFTFHYYGYNPDLDTKKRVDTLQGYLNAVNAQRSVPLRMAVGELNATTSTNSGFNPSQVFPWSFEAGQFMVSTVKNVAAYRADFVAPWSVYENSGSKGATDFSTFNANGSQRSSLVHFALMANHRRATLMEGTQTGAGGNSVVHFGMTDESGSTVFLMNTTTTERTYAARLDGTYSSAPMNTKFAFTSSGRVPAEWVGTLPAKTTLMFTLDGNGRRLKRVDFNKAMSDAADTNPAASPVVTDLTVGAAAVGSAGQIQLTAQVPAGVRTRAEFYVNGTLVASRAQEPFAVPFDSEQLANGEHALVVKAFDKDGNADRSESSVFTVANPIVVSGQVSTSSSGLVYNRSTQSFNGSITVSNTSAVALAGPLFVRISGLPTGVSLLNAAGIYKGEPYVRLGSGLAPGQASSAQVSFSNPARLNVRYSAVVYQGTP